MTTPENKFAGLSAINGALSFSTQQTIESMTNPDPKQRRGVDFDLLDRATAAAEQLVATLGPDARVPATGPWFNTSAARILTAVRDVAQQAAPYRPKERRA